MPSIDEAFRDFNTDGVPGSGVYSPEKSVIRSALNASIYASVDNIAALKGLTAVNGKKVFLTDPSRNGLFIFKSGNFSAEIAADTQEGVYVKANAVAATAGAWVRQYEGSINAKWFGVDGTNDHTNIIAAANFISALGGGYLYIPRGIYDIGLGGILLSNLSNVHIVGDGGRATRLKKQSGFTGTAGVVFSSCSNCSVRGVYVDSNGQDGNGIAAGPANFNTLLGTASSNIHVSDCIVELQPDAHNYGIVFFVVEGGSIDNNIIDGMSATPWLNEEMEGIEIFGGGNIRVTRNRVRNLSGNALSMFSDANLLSPLRNIIYENNQAEDCFGFIWGTASFGATNFNPIRNVAFTGNQGRRIYQRGTSFNINAASGVTAPDIIIDGLTIGDNQISFATSADGAVAGATAAFELVSFYSIGGLPADPSLFECRNILHHDNVYDGIDTGTGSIASVGPIKGLTSRGNKYRRKSSTGATCLYLYKAINCSFTDEVFEKSANYGALIENNCTNLALVRCEFIDCDQSNAGTVPIIFNTGAFSTGVKVLDNRFRRVTGTWSSSTLIAFVNGTDHDEIEVRGNRYFGTGTVGDEVAFVGGAPANSNRGTYTMVGTATTFTINTSACTASSLVIVNQLSGTTQTVVRVAPTTGSFTVTIAAASAGAIYSWSVI